MIIKNAKTDGARKSAFTNRFCLMSIGSCMELMRETMAAGREAPRPLKA
jgi:hypothetical protein